MRVYAEEFEQLIADLMQILGFDVERSGARMFRAPDLLLTWRGVITAVEAKFYRARRVDSGQLIVAAEQAEAGRAAVQADHGLLVVSCRVDEIARARLGRFPRVQILDYDGVAELLTGHPALADRFATLIRRASMFGTGEDDAARPVGEAAEILESLHRRSAEGQTTGAGPSEIGMTVPVQRFRGADLCQELRNIEPAPRGSSPQERLARANAFEAKCAECLLHLFDDNFAGDETQFRSQNGLSRFDFVARLRPVGEFWKLLVTDFHARYIVLEFKLYRKPITQGEILTTEKYLYRPALRSVAILISPHGADENALETARGALREHGKLILNLTIDQVCEMLHAKDGERRDGGPVGEVEDPLFETLDDLLMRIER